MSAISVNKDHNLKLLKRLSKKIIKGKAFQKSEFGTGLLDMTLQGAIRKQQVRIAGFKDAPAKLLLRPTEESHASCNTAVRIFIGSEDAQHRGERVLLWSILKHRSPEKFYEVYIMKDLAGFDRRYWKTGFTGYRYAIPDLCEYEGRAIYNDVDQIYLYDPAALQSEGMSDSAVLALNSRDTSVMVMNCEKLKGVWSMEAIQAAPQGKVHATMLAQARRKNLIGNLPGFWNARDHEYDGSSSKLLHFTILHLQPWRPFPKDLRYRDNPHGKVWYTLEEEADHSGFAPEWRQHPGRPYNDMKDFFEVAYDPFTS